MVIEHLRIQIDVHARVRRRVVIRARLRRGNARLALTADAIRARRQPRRQREIESALNGVRNARRADMIIGIAGRGVHRAIRNRAAA